MKIVSSFSLFEDRKETLAGVNEFEDYYKFSIPPIYKLFHEQFSVGRDSLRKVEVYNRSVNKNLNIAELVFSGRYSDFIGLYNFLSLDESISSMKNSYSLDDNIKGMGYAIIGECINNISLLIGMKKDNKDKIYLEDTGLFPSGERIVFVSNNIFDFVRSLSLVEKENVGYGIKSYDSLYKKWGEDFWRVINTNKTS